MLPRQHAVLLAVLLALAPCSAELDSKGSDNDGMDKVRSSLLQVRTIVKGDELLVRVQQRVDVILWEAMAAQSYDQTTGDSKNAVRPREEKLHEAVRVLVTVRNMVVVVLQALNPCMPVGVIDCSTVFDFIAGNVVFRFLAAVCRTLSSLGRSLGRPGRMRREWKRALKKDDRTADEAMRQRLVELKGQVLARKQELLDTLDKIEAVVNKIEEIM